MAIKKVKAAKPPTIKSDDVVVVRTEYEKFRGEQSFTGAELQTAQTIAENYAKRGWRVSVIAYTYRPTAKKGQKCSTVVLSSTESDKPSDAAVA